MHRYNPFRELERRNVVSAASSRTSVWICAAIASDRYGRSLEIETHDGSLFDVEKMYTLSSARGEKIKIREKEVVWLMSALRFPFGTQSLSLSRDRSLHVVATVNLTKLTATKRGIESKLYVRSETAEALADMMQNVMRVTGFPFKDYSTKRLFQSLGLLDASKPDQLPENSVQLLLKATGRKDLDDSMLRIWKISGERMVDTNPLKVIVDLMLPLSELMLLLRV